MKGTAATRTPILTPSGGAAGDGGSAGASGHGGEGGTAPKSVLETEPNDSPNEALSLGIETTVSGSVPPPQDLDYNSLAAPSGAEPGGYFRLYLTDISQSSAAFDVRAALNNGSVVSDDSHPNTSRTILSSTRRRSSSESP